MAVGRSIPDPRGVQAPLNPARAAPVPKGRSRRSGDSAGMTFFAGLLVWFQFAYLTIPRDILVPASEKIVDMSANPVSRLIKLALLVIGAWLVLRHAPLAKQLGRRVNIFFRVFLVMVPVSYLWSISPPDTLARFISILSVLAVAWAFTVTGWHPRRFQNVLRPAITVLLAASVTFIAIAPDLGIEQGDGPLTNAWHGLAGHKNFFAQVASFGVIFWLHAALSGEVRPWRAALGLALAGVCVVEARSSTSLIATVAVTGFLLMLMRSPKGLRRYMPYLVGAFAVIVLAYALAVLNLIPGTSILLEPIAAITGKDTTFSNRSEIWRIIKEHIALAPILGSGYGAYWVGPIPSSPSYTFLGQMWFYPTESHNGYLEIVNDLGYVGLVLLLGYLAVYIRQSLKLMQVDRSQGALFLGLFFQQAIANLSESCWLVINAAFVFPIMTLAVLSLGRALMEQAQPRSAGHRVAPAGRRRGLRPDLSAGYRSQAVAEEPSG